MDKSCFGLLRPGSIAVPAGCHATWIGSLVRSEFHGSAPAQGGLFEGTPEPPANEEWFEWHSLLIAASAARGRFCMAEVGAGYGRWAVAAAVAASRLGLDAELVCIEAEPTHFEMLRQHFRDNGFDPNRHRLIHGAAASRDDPVYFTVGNPNECWGQAITENRDYNWGGLKAQSTVGITLAAAFEGIATLDLIDMDIQGAEAEVIEAAGPLLRERVRRLHIGTHGAEIEARLRCALRSWDFHPVWDFPSGKTVETEVGPVSFHDGVQAWTNPGLT